MENWIVGGLCLLFLCGCGQSKQVASMQSGRTSIQYPELDTFESEHVLGLGYAAEGRDGRPNWAEVRRLASSDSFKSGVSQLESASLPSDVPSDKQAQKEAIVAAATKLSAAGSNEETEAAFNEMMDAIRAFRKVE